MYYDIALVSSSYVDFVNLKGESREEMLLKNTRLLDVSVIPRPKLLLSSVDEDRVKGQLVNFTKKAKAENKHLVLIFRSRVPFERGVIVSSFLRFLDLEKILTVSSV